MTDRSLLDLERENSYLRQRIAHLEADIVDLSAQVLRVQQQIERVVGRQASAPNPLSGGQST
jgi:hypothetical protein